MAEKISATFIFSEKSALNYFHNLAKINYSARKLSKFIIITEKIAKKDEKVKYFEKTEEAVENNNLNENKTILFPLYSYSPISSQDLVNIVKKVEKYKISKLIVCCYKIDNATYKLAEKINDFKIILLNSNDCYIKLIKLYNFYPENLKDLELKDKLKFKEILRLSFSKKHTKGFFISSLLLLFSSFIVRLNIYYVVMSSILLVFTLISFFLPQSHNKEDLKPL